MLHIAFIMDGNGRWAKNQGNDRTIGHAKGAETLKSIVKYCSDIGIEEVTFYAFSTENWKRTKMEVDFLMNLLVKWLKKEQNYMNQNNVRLKIFGNIQNLSHHVQSTINYVTSSTEKNNGIKLNIAVNYGGRSEIVNCVNKILQDRGIITEESINNNLYVGSPDIIIRTGGEKRLSNFLLWQSAYSELFFTDTLWPDFTNEELRQIINDFDTRDRRYGGINEN